MQRVVFFLIAMMAVAAQAQVIRCINPKTGQVTYSDQRCDNSQSSSLVERRKSHEEIMSERLQAAEANEQKYRNRLAEMEVQQQARQQAPVVAQQPPPDKSTSYECRLAQKNHETTSNIMTGTSEQRRNRINASTIKVNAACGMKTELMQAPPVIINNRTVNFTGCASGLCYDNRGRVYHQISPELITGPDGQTCNRAGASWICN